MKLTIPACNEPLSEAEGSRIRERAKGNVGGVTVERRGEAARLTMHRTLQCIEREDVYSD